MKKQLCTLLIFSSLMAACDNTDNNENEPILSSEFKEISEIKIGGEAAAEITAYDPVTQQLFVVNNSSGSSVDVIDFSDPSNMSIVSSIDITTFGGGVNSVAVKNELLAIAVEADTKTDNGKVVLFKTNNLTSPEAILSVGALPDMVTFSPDGKYILSANEGEPNDDYTIDPKGSISIIDVANSYAVKTLDFEPFNSKVASLEEQGFRVFGPNATLAQDVEPEYITIDSQSQTAWVTLQENNGIAKVDLISQQITDIFPLGTKDFSQATNLMDASNKDDQVLLSNHPVMSFYQPDAIASFEINGVTYLVTANEGDVRDYEGFSEEVRVKDITLDPATFNNVSQLQLENNLGRLIVTNTKGDTNQDGIYETLYGFGARSFSIWNGSDGSLVSDCSTLEKDLMDTAPSHYDDGRSDDKGVEPEGVAIGAVNGKILAFVGLERADAVLVYDVSVPESPQFMQTLLTGDAPEGILFIDADKSPTSKPLLLVSSEDDGYLKVYSI
ncbi:choice-of-anchor I family protein [Limibacter armeniacum]|uniref:choice-of-anchor I family protein n=1 Tax=Limibacter armeniacum TaxID=466084 RepID=UPI002FE66A64